MQLKNNSHCPPGVDVTIFTNARIFTPTATNPDNPFQDAMITNGSQIQYIGSQTDRAILDAKEAGARENNLNNHIVVPGFIDSHMHILDFALSQQKVNLLPCKSLDDIRSAIKRYAEAHPDAERIVCKSWMQASTGGVALATMLDGIEPAERPVYIQAMDFHSSWCNTAALQEMGAAGHDMKRDPPGGEILRGEDGKPSGLFSENAHFAIVVPFLMSVISIEDKLAALENALAAYTAAGYTGMIDMAMDEEQWVVLQAFRQRHGGELPFHIAAHWLVPYLEDQEEVFKYVGRAASLQQEFHPSTSPNFCIAGIKLISDGVVDGCTAALSQPYTSTAAAVYPIWPAERQQAVVQRADAAGLQIAIHAIGDQAVNQSINCLSQVKPGRRHRIEHLELTSPEDAKRLGQLGITASVQPVHSDPVLFRAWPSLIGKHRCGRAFAYREFLEGGAAVALGTDAPTAAHFALPNLYNGTTRKSAIEPESDETVNTHFGLPLVDAVTAATTGAAYSRFADSWTGSLKPGLSADFVVLDMDWKAEGSLTAQVNQTWFRGRKTFDLDTGL